MIDPRCFSDCDGRYIGADKKIHQTKNFTYRTVFSGWDVFRSQFPLQTLINPRLVNDEINSLIQIAQLSGRKYYPRWEVVNAYSGCMLGNPAISVLADAYEKGIREYDVQKAVEYAANTQKQFGNGDLGYTPGSLSHTLEYAYTDWCLGQLMSSLGKKKEAAEYEAADKKRKEAIDAKNEAEAIITQTEQAMSEAGDKLSDSDKQAVQADIDALKATVSAIGENEPTEAQVEELKSGKEKLMNSAQQLFQKMYEQAQAAGAQGAGPDMGAGANAGSNPGDDVVDGDFTEV